MLQHIFVKTNCFAIYLVQHFVQNYGMVFIHYIIEKCSSLGLQPDYMLEDYLGCSSDHQLIDGEHNENGYSSSQGNQIAEHALSLIENSNGVSFGIIVLVSIFYNKHNNLNVFNFVTYRSSLMSY